MSVAQTEKSDGPPAKWRNTSRPKAALRDRRRSCRVSCGTTPWSRSAARSRISALFDYGRGRKAGERCEGREISGRVKTPPKSLIVFNSVRHLAFRQPTKFRVDRLGDSNRRDHHQHDESEPGPRKRGRGARLRLKAKNIAAAPAITPRMGIIGSARNSDRRNRRHTVQGAFAATALVVQRRKLTSPIKPQPAAEPPSCRRRFIRATVSRRQFAIAACHGGGERREQEEQGRFRPEVAADATDGARRRGKSGIAFQRIAPANYRHRWNN